VGCGRRAPQAELQRLALRDGALVPDPRRRLGGRGAYVCGPPCGREALRRGAFPRAMRRRVTVMTDFVESDG
jgi:predicted RNA-binding protein YlxR (DUF448 family)